MDAMVSAGLRCARAYLFFKSSPIAADGGADLLGRLSVGAALLVQRGLKGLEPSRLAGGETDCRRQPAGRTRREAAGESTNSRHRGSLWLHR